MLSDGSAEPDIQLCLKQLTQAGNLVLGIKFLRIKLSSRASHGTKSIPPWSCAC